jgi:hypothetical protein
MSIHHITRVAIAPCHADGGAGREDRREGGWGV